MLITHTNHLFSIYPALHPSEMQAHWAAIHSVPRCTICTRILTLFLCQGKPTLKWGLNKCWVNPAIPSLLGNNWNGIRTEKIGWWKPVVKTCTCSSRWPARKSASVLKSIMYAWVGRVYLFFLKKRKLSVILCKWSVNALFACCVDWSSGQLEELILWIRYLGLACGVQQSWLILFNWINCTFCPLRG